MEIAKSSDSGNPKSRTDVVKSNPSFGSPITLEYVESTEVVQFSEEEWDEEARIWKFPTVIIVANIKPSYTEMSRWVTLNWGKLAPKLSQIKAGVFLVDFQSEDDRLDVLCKNWTFYHKASIVLKPWDVDRELDQQGIDSTPVWVQLPGLPSRL